MADVDSGTCQDELDVPLLKLLSLPQLPHVGYVDPSGVDESSATGKASPDVTAVSGGQKTTSPRFSSFFATSKRALMDRWLVEGLDEVRVGHCVCNRCLSPFHFVI